jgi:hypothetical protein
LEKTSDKAQLPPVHCAAAALHSVALTSITASLSEELNMAVLLMSCNQGGPFRAGPGRIALIKVSSWQSQSARHGQRKFKLLAVHASSPVGLTSVVTAIDTHCPAPSVRISLMRLRVGRHADEIGVVVCAAAARVLRVLRYGQSGQNRDSFAA